MLVQVSNMPLSLDAALPEGDSLRTREIARALGVKPRVVKNARLLKRSVDARKKSNVHFVASFEVELDDAPLNPARGVNVGPAKPFPKLEVPDAREAFATSGRPRPVVVGTGPAGLFCGLYLARAGLRPLLVERGACVEERVRAIEAFDAGGPLNTATNIQFGEGGAGTFSDGKLNTGTKSPHIRHVLEEFVAAGAPGEILWQAKPHIGTDKLVGVVRNLRQQIIALGGEVRFGTLMEKCVMEEAGPHADARLAGVVLRDLASGEEVFQPADCVVLACGHSARDTFEMLHDGGVLMQRKPFAVGVRIEHPQAAVSFAQYGRAAEHPALGAADYKLAVHTKAGRGVYTFCMCPGGEVVAAASEEGGVCVNGMSRFARDGENANSALLVEVKPDDFPGNDVLAGVAFQRKLERAAFELGGESYAAPAQTVGDFLAGACGNASESVSPSYPRGVAWRDLRECLPAFVADAMAEALPLLDRKLSGFADADAVMTAVEARSSSPVRIVRDDAFRAFVASVPRGASDGEGADAGRPRRAAVLSASPACETLEGGAPGASTRGRAVCAADSAAGGASGKDGVCVGEAPLGYSPCAGLHPCGEGAGYAGGITSAAVDGLRVAEAIVAQLLASRG